MVTPGKKKDDQNAKLRSERSRVLGVEYTDLEEHGIKQTEI